MAPILAELSRTYAGRASIEIIDIGEHPEEAQRYEVRLIPTQIFLDAGGREVWRHEGFLPRAEIVAKLAEMGVAEL
jgi:thioredoxin 1